MSYTFERMIAWSVAQRHIGDAQDCLARAMDEMRSLEEAGLIYGVTAQAFAGLMDAEKFCAERKAACHLLMMVGTLQELPEEEEGDV